MKRIDKAFELLVRKEPDVALVIADPPTIVPSWLNRHWRYQPASTHADSEAFRARQRDRIKRLTK